MLDLAVKAGIPIIAIKHSDVVNVGDVLSYVLKKPVVPYPLGNEFDPAKSTLAKSTLKTTDIFYITRDDFVTTDQVYAWFVDQEKTLILVNHVGSHHAFDAGTLAVPIGLIRKTLKDVIDNETIESILPLLKGLTLKSMIELIKLTSAKDKTITYRSISKNRGFVAANVQGLNEVNKDQDLYFPHKELKDYITLNKAFFKSPKTPQPLVPRGLLLNGLAGTGKTAASKFVATEFDVPLYRLDLSASLSKFVGSSESKLAAILDAVEKEPSCVLLIDEVEKLFQESDDSGVTSRLLAQLLWFLQEHKGRIFTVMTSNNIDKIPPELYRSGRLDKVITIPPMDLDQAITLGFALTEQYTTLDVDKKQAIHNTLLSLNKSQANALTAANITATVNDLVKKQQWITL